MILYHGSLEVIETPNLSFSRENTDFGKGFYTTSIKSQAISWTNRFKRRFGYGTLSIYEFDEQSLQKNISILEFDTYSTQWLEYITKCRLGESVDNYDLVIGGIANDDVYNTLTLYFRGFIEKEEAIKRLRYEKPNIQYCFKSQAVIDNYLIYTGKEKI
ncbi:MAG: DUF3990 domain-containing protein [Treponema sp.]|jgi:hypothetical protein|nr:DUF3990 domain-containing protein [Treponema sp.]